MKEKHRSEDSRRRDSVLAINWPRINFTQVLSFLEPMDFYNSKLISIINLIYIRYNDKYWVSETLRGLSILQHCISLEREVTTNLT